MLPATGATAVDAGQRLRASIESCEICGGECWARRNDANSFVASAVGERVRLSGWVDGSLDRARSAASVWEVGGKRREWYCFRDVRATCLGADGGDGRSRCEEGGV